MTKDRVVGRGLLERRLLLLAHTIKGKWTTIVKDKYEISSSVNFIIVDSFTSAMLASDKLFSTQEYFENIFELDGKRKAQKVLFAEQSKLMANEIDVLFANE